MKLRFLFIIFLSFPIQHADAQILCINCFNQNDSISDNVNNLILNGSFENSNCLPTASVFCPNSTSYTCDILNWICTGGGASTYASVSDSTSINTMIVEGDYAVYFGNSFCHPCSGLFNDTSCLNQDLCTIIAPPAGYPVNDTAFGYNTGLSLQQTVTGLISGNIYVLEFWAGGESPLAAQYPSEGLFAVDIGFGNTFLKDPPTIPLTGIGRRYVIQFVATSLSHTIKFTNWGHVCSGCTELVLDHVRLYTLAELDNGVAPCISAITEEHTNILNLFPVPVTDQLNIQISGNGNYVIVIYDVSSRIVLQQQFTKSVSLNVEAFSKGIYFYQVLSKYGIAKKGKFVKE